MSKETIRHIFITLALLACLALIVYFAFTGDAPHVVDDQYAPVSYP